MTLDEYDELYLEERDDLALRSIRGETLSREDSARLEELNTILESLLPAPTPLPAEALETIAEVNRMLGNSRHARVDPLHDPLPAPRSKPHAPA